MRISPALPLDRVHQILTQPYEGFASSSAGMRALEVGRDQLRQCLAPPGRTHTARAAELGPPQIDVAV